MHELSIAIAIVDGVLDEAERRGGVKVEGVRVRIGRLAGVDRDALLFAYQVARQDTPLASSQLEIEEVGAAIYCPTCAEEREVNGSMICPRCGSTVTTVLRGQELEITALELAA